MRRTGRILSIIIRILVIVAIIAVGVVIYSTCAGSPLIQKIDKTLPNEIDTPFKITTMTKLYYAKKAILNDDGSVTMFNWYEQINTEWVFNKGDFTIPPVLRPEIKRR